MKKLLALNRSEIAIRILRAANELGLRTVAIYAQEDRLALHRDFPFIEGNFAMTTYLECVFHRLPLHSAMPSIRKYPVQRNCRSAAQPSA